MSNGKKMQLNIRVTADTADSFRAFCVRNDLSQSDAIDLLLAPDNTEKLGEYAGPWEELADLKKLADENKKEIQTLRKKCGEIRAKESVRREILTDLTRELFLRVQRKGEQEHEVTHDPIVPTRLGRAKQFRSYAYPTEAGCMHIKLVDLVRAQGQMSPWGEPLPTPLFILATGADGQEVKFRAYKTADFIGAFFDSDYAYAGAEWLVAYEIAADGATDLIAAIPMDLRALTEDSAQETTALPQPEPQEEMESLDDRLRRINNRLYP